MVKDFNEIAIKIQDASNPIAVTGELREAIIDARTRGINERKDPAVLAIFYKVYNMLGDPSEKEMYHALKQCELIEQAKKHVWTVGGFGIKKKSVTKKR